MSELTIPKNYKNLLSVKDTENAIKLIKDTFEHNISSELKMRRITASLKITGSEDRKDLLFHKKLLHDELPLSIGGGIGQSRLCMLFLRKAHIGEVQSSIWPEQTIEECERNNIHIL